MYFGKWQKAEGTRCALNDGFFCRSPSKKATSFLDYTRTRIPCLYSADTSKKCWLWIDVEGHSNHWQWSLLSLVALSLHILIVWKNDCFFKSYNVFFAFMSSRHRVGKEVGLSERLIALPRLPQVAIQWYLLVHAKTAAPIWAPSSNLSRDKRTHESAKYWL